MRIFTKSGLDWTGRFPGIAHALEQLDLRSAAIDGEAVILDASGVSDFHALRGALERGRARDAALIALDLLHLDGEDLRTRPLEERLARLAGVVPEGDAWLQLSHEVPGDGPEVHRGARALGLEGIVSKRLGSPYVSGKYRGWVKAKCTTTEHFAVTGIERAGGRERRSVTLAQLVGDMHLVPCGSAGSGLTDQDLREIRAALRTGLPIIAEVEHRGLTPDGQLRHPVVRGWSAMS